MGNADTADLLGSVSREKKRCSEVQLLREKIDLPPPKKVLFKVEDQSQSARKAYLLKRKSGKKVCSS